MRLTVRHVTTYRYARPMRTMVQSLKLTPSRFDGQTTIDWRVGVTAEAQGQSQSMGGMSQAQGFPADVTQGAAFRDGAGDWTQTVSLRGPVGKVEISVTGQVETTDLSGVLKNHRETVPPGAYLRATRATGADVALTDLARGVISATEGQGELVRAHALMAAVADAIRYVPGRTGAATTAAEALAQGEGVCQDHAHAMIACALLAGSPARYVVGYLNAEGAVGEASHAWAEIWIDRLGWVGFDPANRCCPDDRYIRLCSGYDAADAAPIRGIAQGDEAEAMDVDVAVDQAAQ